MTTVQFAKAPGSKTPLAVPVIGLASAVSLAAASTLLGYSLSPGGKRRLSSSSRRGLGVLALCAGALMWVERQEEASAARHLLAQVGQARDARWLRKNPVDFG